MIVAFGAGYGVRKAVESGGGSETSPAALVGIPFEDARAVPLGISRGTLIARFPHKPYETVTYPNDRLACLVYVVSDRATTAWQFCFRQGKLARSGRVVRSR